MINRNNYEEYFLDFHEGRLSEEVKKKLMAFLEVNPDLKAEFERFERISISHPDRVFFDKDRLKKNTITLYNYKNWFIALLENDLSEEEKVDVEKFLASNPGFKKELEIIKQTKVLPDYSVQFENKSGIKKG